MTYSNLFLEGKLDFDTVQIPTLERTVHILLPVKTRCLFTRCHCLLSSLEGTIGKLHAVLGLCGRVYVFILVVGPAGQGAEIANLFYENVNFPSLPRNT